MNILDKIKYMAYKYFIIKEIEEEEDYNHNESEVIEDSDSIFDSSDDSSNTVSSDHSIFVEEKKVRKKSVELRFKKDRAFTKLRMFIKFN